MSLGAASRRDGLVVLLLCLLALALRALAVSQYEAAHPQAERPVIDERSYDGWAREIAAGDWIGTQVYFQEPLYPYWLGAVYKLSGGDRSAARYAQAAAGALTVLLVYLLGRRLFGPVAAAIGALGLAVYRPAVHLSALLLKENLFLPVVAGLALALVVASAADEGARPARRSLRWALCGLLAAFGALLRGNLLVLLPVILAWPLWLGWKRERRLIRGAAGALALACGAALAFTPVALRNWHVGGVFALTTSGAGTNLYGGNNATNPYGRASECDWVRGIPEHEADDWRHEAERRLGRALDPTEVSGYWMSQVWQSAKRDPALHLSILWNKLRLTLGSYEVPDNHSLYWDQRYVPILRWPLPGFAVLGWLGLWGLLLALVALRATGPPRLERAGTLLLALLALAYLGTVVLTVTSDRIRLGLVPLLAPFAGHALVSALSAPGARGLGRTLVCAALAGVCVWPPVFDDEQRRADLDKRDFNHAVYSLDTPGGLEEAQRIALELDRRHPDTSRVQTLIAEIDWKRARALVDVESGPAARALVQEMRQDALDRLRVVVEATGVNARERFRAQRLAGLIQLDTGKPEVAERRFREALQFDPSDRELRVWLAEALLRQAPAAGGDARARMAGEARDLLETLLSERSEPELAAMLLRAFALLLP